RRGHARLVSDWSSDVCSSDLGTGNAGPWPGDMHPGDNLYSSSVLALDADTGKIRGHHQYHWNDSWDWDEVSTPLLIDFPKDGREIGRASCRERVESGVVAGDV